MGKSILKLKLNFADIHLSIHSDVMFPLLNSPDLTSFQDHTENNNADFFILQFPDEEYNLSSPNAKEIEQLTKIIGFQKRWAKNNIVNSPQIRYLLQECMKRPEFCQVEMAWDRVIIRDYELNRFYLYYPANRATDLMSPLFFAGFRNLISAAFPNHAAILLHGAGVIIDGKAAIFLAKDEGGKTTIAKCFKPKNILNDDQIIIKKENSSYFVYSTPFGTLGSIFQGYQLEGIFLLEKSKKLQIDKISKNKILEFIWNEHFFHTMVMPNIIRTKQFKLLCDILNDTPCYCLQFPIEGINEENIRSVPNFN